MTPSPQSIPPELAEDIKKYKLNKPLVGDSLRYRNEHCGTVTRIDQSICYYEQLDGSHNLFIWAFHDGLNQLYDWPNKWQTKLIISGDPIKIVNSRAG